MSELGLRDPGQAERIHAVYSHPLGNRDQLAKPQLKTAIVASKAGSAASLRPAAPDIHPSNSIYYVPVVVKPDRELAHSSSAQVLGREEPLERQKPNQPKALNQLQDERAIMAVDVGGCYGL